MLQATLLQGCSIIAKNQSRLFCEYWDHDYLTRVLTDFEDIMHSICFIFFNLKNIVLKYIIYI